jgi:hypothetical protein
VNGDAWLTVPVIPTLYRPLALPRSATRLEHTTAFAPLGEHWFLTGLATVLDVTYYARLGHHENMLIIPNTSNPEKNLRVSIGPFPFPFLLCLQPFLDLHYRRYNWRRCSFYPSLAPSQCKRRGERGTIPTTPKTDLSKRAKLVRSAWLVWATSSSALHAKGPFDICIWVSPFLVQYSLIEGTPHQCPFRGILAEPLN